MPRDVRRHAPRAILAAFALILPGAAPVAALEAGTLLLGVHAVTGAGDYAAEQGGYFVPDRRQDVGLSGDGWWFFADGVALALAGRLHAGRDLMRAPGLPDRVVRSAAWSARAGLDRFVEIGDGVHLFIGPGVEVWRGRASHEGVAGPGVVNGPRTWRVSGCGRLGALLVLGDSFALTGHVDCRVGWAEAAWEDRSARWAPGGVDGAAGVVWAF
uniref:Outer membrane protein beta-barrel domain-containing protein n=1 Tax=Eiseniibacteriota bacterium TaxID=2212470 RepID=A0A832MLK3_UNCEI